MLTGIIKANFPARISFQVSSRTDSRTILDQSGAEHLLGQGDMLFLPPGTSKLQRLHGSFVSEREVAKLAEFLRTQGAPNFDEDLVRLEEESAATESRRRTRTSITIAPSRSWPSRATHRSPIFSGG